MQLQLWVLTSVWTIVQSTLGPHMPFFPVLHPPLYGPEFAFHDPLPPFLSPGLTGPHRAFPRRILIIRAPPGARFPFGESHLGGMLRPLPNSLFPRQLRRFRPLPYGPRVPAHMGAHPISLSKYGYERPDFHDMDVVRRRFRSFRDRDYRDRYRMSRWRDSDRYTDMTSDYYRDSEFRFGRDGERSFPRDVWGISRRFDSPGAVRRAIPAAARRSRFSERVSTLHKINQPKGVSKRLNSSRKASMASRRQGARRGRGQRGNTRKRSKNNRPIFRPKQTPGKGNVKSNSKVLDLTKAAGSVIAKTVDKSSKLPDANVIDLTQVNVPGETNNIVNSGGSGPVDNAIIDLTHLDQEPPSPEIKELVKTDPSAVLQADVPGNAISENIAEIQNLPPAGPEPEPIGVKPSINLEPPPVILEPDVALTGASKAKALSAPNLTNTDKSSTGVANIVGAAHSLKADPLAPEVSILELGKTGSIPSDLLGLGNVDVLTLSKEGFTELEKAIQSGKTINADVLNSIIGNGGAGGVSGTGAAGAGPDIVVIDHPSAGHTSAGHVEHVVDAGPSAAKHVHLAESKVPSIARATTVLSPGHSGHSMSDISVSPHDPQHGSHKANIVGVVGESVGAVEASGATDVLGLFTVPSNSDFPKVPKSVSVIPSSIGQLLNGISKDHVAHKVH